MKADYIDLTFCPPWTAICGACGCGGLRQRRGLGYSARICSASCLCTQTLYLTSPTASTSTAAAAPPIWRPCVRVLWPGNTTWAVAFDGDADRCLLVDEKGNVIDGDKVSCRVRKVHGKRGILNGNAIVATVMSNLGLHEFCRKGDYELVCTDVGDRHVLGKRCWSAAYRIGGEQSGHTIFREFATTGDSVS